MTTDVTVTGISATDGHANYGLTAEKQDDALATYAPMISKEDGHIDFRMEPEEIERRIRAFDPWPGSFVRLEDKTYKFWKAECVLDDVEKAEHVPVAENMPVAECVPAVANRAEQSERGEMTAPQTGEGCVPDADNQAVVQSGEGRKPGTILAAGDRGIDIAAGQSGTGILRVTEIQAPGKKRTPVKDYLRGNTIVIGAILR